MAVTLADYQNQVRRLVHDANKQFWSDTDLNSYINLALQQRDRDTGANRSIQSLTLVAGTDTYTLSSLSNPSVFDVVGINLIYGSTRRRLRQVSKSTLDTTYRPWTTFQGYPVAYARLGHSSFILGPAPGSAYTTEWDCLLFSAALSAVTDADVLPYPYTDPVQYYAAYLCKLQEQAQAESDRFLKLYNDRLMNVINTRWTMIDPDPYNEEAAL